ncbi:hypothetical protein AeRB84_012955 [Aphanomyces euteiches]|nr:hypothetical protein AeRB84_012955 [Aphanomyces euteiches]
MASEKETTPAVPDRGRPSMDDMAKQADTLRRQIGDAVSAMSSGIDDNLMLFRWGCFATMASRSNLIAALISPFDSRLVARTLAFDRLTRYTSLETLPVGVPIKARVLGQSATDPSTLYVYHTPWLRRVLLKETMPKGMEAGVGLLTDKSSLLAVRPYGVEMQDEAKRWIYVDFVASRRYVTVELLYRPPASPEAPVGACSISTSRGLFFRSDMAEYAVTRGIAICRAEPEFELAKPNMSNRSIHRLNKRTKRLMSSEQHAQTMRYGMWKDWAEETMSDRVVSAGKRASHAAMQRIFGSWWPM